MKKKSLIKRLLILGFCTQALLTSGCMLFLLGAAAGAGVAGTAWYMGSLSGTETGTVKQVENATVAAFKDLNIQQTSLTSETSESVVKGKNPKGDSVKVTIEKKSEDTCDVTIRIGTFGDSTASTALYGKIRENLGTTPPAAK